MPFTTARVRPGSRDAVWCMSIRLYHDRVAGGRDRQQMPLSPQRAPLRPVHRPTPALRCPARPVRDPPITLLITSLIQRYLLLRGRRKRGVLSSGLPTDDDSVHGACSGQLLAATAPPGRSARRPALARRPTRSLARHCGCRAALPRGLPPGTTGSAGDRSCRGRK